MKRTKERLAPMADPPSHLRILEAAESGDEPSAPGPATKARWTVVDANGSPHGERATRSEAVRLMSTLAGRMPAVLPLRVVDREGHETGDRLA